MLWRYEMSLTGWYVRTKKNCPVTLEGTTSVTGQCDNGKCQCITRCDYLSALSLRPKRSAIFDEVCARSVSLAAFEAL